MKTLLLSLALCAGFTPAIAQEPAPVLQLREDIKVLAVFGIGNHLFAVLASPLPTGGRSIELVDLSTGETVLMLLEGVKATPTPSQVAK